MNDNNILLGEHQDIESNVGDVSNYLKLSLREKNVINVNGLTYNFNT